MHCIETQNLSYKFAGKAPVLKDINLQVPSGSIYGFIGPNGAGKTTTLKLVLGLLKKQSGNIRIFDREFETDRVDILKQVGSLIESPSFYTHLTAAENLALLQKIYQCPKNRIEEVLGIVDLLHTKNKKAGQFSLGMKQRLSIAIAFLHSPSLLILDEPTNGLDPNGIIEIRELLKKLNSTYQTTILISSHLLFEIEKLVTHVGIINKGSILFQGTMEELHIKQSQTATVAFTTNDQEKTVEIMRSRSLDPRLLNGQVLIPAPGTQVIAEINAQLVNSKVDVYQIYTIKNDLESIFMDLTRNQA